MILQTKDTTQPDIIILDKVFGCTQWAVAAMEPALSPMRVVEVDLSEKTVKYRLPAQSEDILRVDEKGEPYLETMEDLDDDYLFLNKPVYVVTPYTKITIRFFAADGKVTKITLEN